MGDVDCATDQRTDNFNKRDSPWLETHWPTVLFAVSSSHSAGDQGLTLDYL